MRSFCLAWLGSGAILLTPARAQAETKLRVVVRSVGDTQAMLVRRITGQTSELPVQLIVDTQSKMESSLSTQLDQAASLAIDHEATVVVWTDWASVGGERRILIYVAHPKSGRVLVRSLDASDSKASGDSANLEAAALIVRTALKALAAGGEIGVDRAQVDPPKLLPPPSVPEPPVVAPPHPQAKAKLGWTLLAGGQYARDGLSSGQSSIFVGAGLSLSRQWETGAVAHSSLPVEIMDAWTRVQLAERGVGIFGAYRIPMSKSLFLVPRVTLGATGFWRATLPIQENVVANAAKVTLSPWVGAGLQIQWYPEFSGGALGFGVWGELNYLPSAPLLHYEITGQSDNSTDRQVAKLQPSIGAGVLLRAW